MMRLASKNALVAQRRFARTRADGYADRFGPDSAKVYTQHACTLGSIILTFLGTSIAVGNFEVENPWEHFFAAVPRGLGTQFH